MNREKPIKVLTPQGHKQGSHDYTAANVVSHPRKSRSFFSLALMLFLVCNLSAQKNTAHVEIAVRKLGYWFWDKIT